MEDESAPLFFLSRTSTGRTGCVFGTSEKWLFCRIRTQAAAGVISSSRGNRPLLSMERNHLPDQAG